MSLILGVTGGIASGKSTVSRFFSQRGIPVVDADEVAREAVLPGSKGLNRISEAFGKELLLKDGTLNRSKLAQLIFADSKKREQLNAILQADIRERIMEKISMFKKANPPLIVLDIPLLYEEHYENLVDLVLVVTVPYHIQKKRLMNRQALTAAEAEQRIFAQMPLSQKENLADIVIENKESIEALEKRLLLLLDDIV